MLRQWQGRDTGPGGHRGLLGIRKGNQSSVPQVEEGLLFSNAEVKEEAFKREEVSGTGCH